ncbi:MAG: glycosyltransferase family 2 protein [Bacteroidales bacterium]|nr:glycosyltransferase family 2 protein [Bacteroidales bacterium]
MKIAVITIYFLCLTLIFIFSLFQVQLAVLYLKNRKKRKSGSISSGTGQSAPFVTIQLPLYNEVYVANRLLDCVSAIDWPTDKFEIQVLDDSTDETSEIVQTKLAELNKREINTRYIQRTERDEYKAGALRNGLLTARGDFIAIFDADFLPDPDFLKKTLPHFEDSRIGAVQTRWGHINRDYSILSRLQAFALDVHFTIEQAGRNSKDYFINFNGTAGVWRKDAIIDAGNWQGDTLVEDLDLSYRAQIRGWKIKYLEDVVTPAELPVEFNAIKNQQFRWIKGGAQNFIKNSSSVLNARLPFLTKVNALFHMLNSSVFILTFLIAALSYPVFLVQVNYPEFNIVFSIGSVFMLTTLFIMSYYAVAFFASGRKALFTEHLNSIFCQKRTT